MSLRYYIHLQNISYDPIVVQNVVKDNDFCLECSDTVDLDCSNIHLDLLIY